MAAPGGKPGTPFTAEQAPAGFAALQRRLQGTGSPPAATLVVLEATGNYWVAFAVALHEVGYRIAVVNPRQAHHCAKAQLRRAKTDALDAADLAQFAAALRPASWTPPPAVYHELSPTSLLAFWGTARGVVPGGRDRLAGAVRCCYCAGRAGS